MIFKQNAMGNIVNPGSSLRGLGFGLRGQDFESGEDLNRSNQG